MIRNRAGEEIGLGLATIVHVADVERGANVGGAEVECAEVELLHSAWSDMKAIRVACRFPSHDMQIGSLCRVLIPSLVVGRGSVRRVEMVCCSNGLNVETTDPSYVIGVSTEADSRPGVKSQCIFGLARCQDAGLFQ